ncbi:MAG: hypothetical protein ACE5KM_09505 [Planctomycetaceae bacterium]
MSEGFSSFWQHFSHLKFAAKALNRQDAKVAKQKPTDRERTEIKAGAICSGRNSLKSCASPDLLLFLALLASWRFTPYADGCRMIHIQRIKTPTMTFFEFP